MKIAVVLSVTLAVGCVGAGSPARFAGKAAEPRTKFGDLAEVDLRPDGYRILGRVIASCEDDQRVERLEEARLGDVACSDDMLLAALREKAADVGGDLLVGPRCSKSGSVEVRHTCQGRVARREGEAPKELPPGAVLPSPRRFGDAPWLAAPRDAWRVSVSFTPAGGAPPRSARHPDEVRESPYLPASDVPMGDLVARCDGTCRRAVVREAVRAGAARVGATSVSEVSCVDGAEGRVCTGRAGRFEVEPDGVASAQ